LTDTGDSVLAADSVDFGYPEQPLFFRGVTFTASAGQCWGILGPNGAGKSTLLRLLAGLLAPRAGSVRLAGRSIGEMSLRARAQVTAFLPQHLPRQIESTARELVLLGRHPYRQLGLFECAEDVAIARRAMETTQTLDLAERPMSTLSGGEAQRVHLAAALAQSPRVLLLDEPTASLDLFHQLHIFSILSELARRDGLTVVVVTHDLNLAARFCSHVVLLDEGRVVATGRPRDVITPERLEGVYDVSLAEARVEGRSEGWVVPLWETERGG
jgi:iron complex transport system ATP-binding protein